jgi:hypothetical protein
LHGSYAQIDDYTIGSEASNALWVRELFGAAELSRIGASRVSCAGFTLGGRAPMLAYAQRMHAEITTRIAPRYDELKRRHGAALARGFDQGVHNVLLHAPAPLPALRIAPHGLVFNGNRAREGAHFALSGPTMTPPPRQLSPHAGAQSYAVLHQYGRLRKASARKLADATFVCERPPRPPYCTFCEAANMPIAAKPNRSSMPRRSLRPRIQRR